MLSNVDRICWINKETVAFVIMSFRLKNITDNRTNRSREETLKTVFFNASASSYQSKSSCLPICIYFVYLLIDQSGLWCYAKRQILKNLNIL